MTDRKNKIKETIKSILPYNLADRFISCGFQEIPSDLDTIGEMFEKL